MTTLAECRKLAKKVGWTIKVNKHSHKKYIMLRDGEYQYWAANLDVLKQTIELEISCWETFGCSGKTECVATPIRGM